MKLKSVLISYTTYSEKSVYTLDCGQIFLFFSHPFSSEWKPKSLLYVNKEKERNSASQFFVKSFARGNPNRTISPFRGKKSTLNVVNEILTKKEFAALALNI